MKESFVEINEDTENDMECKTSSDIMESTYNDLKKDLSGNMIVDESETDMSFVFTSTPVKESCKECLDKSGCTRCLIKQLLTQHGDRTSFTFHMGHDRPHRVPYPLATRQAAPESLGWG